MDYWENPNYDDDERYREPEPTTCKFCGKRNLYWVQTELRWELQDHRGVHVCNKLQTSKGFELEEAE